MEEFKQILMRKAKIIDELKYPQRSNREATLKYLKNIKKSEKQTQPYDLQALNSLSHLHFQSKQLFQKVYFISFTIMKGLCKNFQFIPEEKETFSNIVEMHYKFYVKEGALDKAGEIKLAFRKKTYEKEFFIQHLLSSLYDWGKRKLEKFLNKNILSIEKDLLAEKLQSPNKFVQTLQKVQKTMLIKDSIFEGSIMNISYTEKLWKSQKSEIQQTMKTIINRNINLFAPQNNPLKIDQFLSNQIIQQEAELMIDSASQRIETFFEPERSNELTPGNLLPKQRSKSYNRDYFDKKSFLSQNLNKEIFYGTYWKEMSQLYRNLNCLEDLDPYYLKTFKKQKEERKEELIKNRIDEIVDFIIKNMPKIKKSVETYDFQYSKNCPCNIKDFHTESSKILQEENRNKIILKNLSFKKSQKGQFFEQQKNGGTQKSQQKTNQNELTNKGTKKTAIYRTRERNKSLNDGVMRKSTQQKVQMQAKLPIVYNPEDLYNMAESETQKSLAIHQKFQKFLLNGARPNKGLLRYKRMNKERQKNGERINQAEDKIGFYQSSFIEKRKQHEYEVANIRRILRKREKDRLTTNKTPTYQSSKEDEIKNNVMLNIKVMETKYDGEFGSTKKTDKFQIFLGNLKNGESTSFGMNQSVKSSNFGRIKNSKFDYRLDFKSFKDELLPKIL